METERLDEVLWPTRDQLTRPQPGESLSASLARQIERWIQDKGVPAGTQLPAERILVERWSLSRTVLREAFRILGQKGFLRTQPGQGTFVTEPSTTSLSGEMSRLLQRFGAELWHLVEAREMLELRTVRLAARRASASDLRQLQAFLAELENSDAEMEAYRSADIKFHRAIARASGNPMLLILFDAFTDLMTELHHMTTALPRSRLYAQEYHRQIMTAILSRDEESAVAAMARHLHQSIRDLAETAGER